MILYLLKILTSSAIFLAIYYLFLQREKMYSFNRYYLLFNLFAIFTIPFIKIGQIEAVEKPLSEVVSPLYSSMPQIETTQVILPQESSVNSPKAYVLIYAIISGGMLLRFISITSLLFLKAAKNEKVNLGTSKVVLVNDNIAPHSFLNYIFINKKDYKNLSDEILFHELEHTRRQHTVDIIIVELLIVFFWFNPFLYVYRQAIKLNHEFLADQAVLCQFNDIKSYQSLLIRNYKKFQIHSFASQLNFSNTKKRFIMMTKVRSTRRILIKQITLIPILLIAVYFFSEKTIAQKEEAENDKIPSVVNTIVQEEEQSKNSDNVDGKYSFYAPANDEGATDQQMMEYASIVDKYRSTESKTWWKDFRKDISKEDQKRLESLFLQMSLDQQKQQSVVFFRPMGTLAKKIPTTQQIESWKDPKMYGLWIDEKRVENSILNEYVASDFSHLFVSKLAKNAKNYGKHYYQVNLMTNEHFIDFNDKKESEKGSYRMMFHIKRHSYSY